MYVPIRDVVLVLAQNDSDKWTQGGVLWRPDSTKERSDQGFVKAVGPDVRDVKVGDYVIFSPYSGVLVNDDVEGDKLIALKEYPGVIAIITPKSTVLEDIYVYNLESGTYQNATSEVVALKLREAYGKIPRVVTMRNKGPST